MIQTREEIQQDSVELSVIHPKLILELATGVGKSLAAIKIIKKHGGLWSIVIAETNHELNWRDEFIKHGEESLLKDIKFFCYQSLHKHLDGENYVMDEIHHLQSDKRLSMASKINFKRLIGLSATLSRKQIESLVEAVGTIHIHKVNLSEAISYGILPEPVVYFVGVTLDNKVRNLKYYFGKEKFVMCTEQEMYTRFTNRIETLKLNYFATNTLYDKVKWLKLANDRKKFLSDCKTPYAKELLQILDSKRLICFTGSIEQSESLSNGLSVHSKIGKKVRESMIADFNNGITSKLFATGMLKEGMNLNNIEAGIICQLDNNLRYFSQTHGRILRSELPEQYVLYVKDTQDETYVTTALEDFNMDYVKFVELKDLKI